MSATLENTLKSINKANRRNLAKEENIKQKITTAWQQIMPVWPIQNFVACNPLLGYEQQKFEHAFYNAYNLKNYSNKFGDDALIDKLNHETIKWLQVYFDNTMAKIPMPNKDKGLYNSIIRIVEYDKVLNPNSDYFKEIISQNPFETIEVLLTKLNVKTTIQSDFIEFLLKSLPGWSGYIKHLYESSKEDNTSILIEFFAIRVLFYWLVKKNQVKTGQYNNFSSASITSLNQNTHNRVICSALSEIKRFEQNYIQDITRKINMTLFCNNNKKRAIADAQYLFCIDPRSEMLRRNIEQRGNYQTFGCAGFFNIAVRVQSEELGYLKKSYPAILETENTIELTAIQDDAKTSYQKNKSKLSKIYKDLKHSFTTPLVLVEILGPLFALGSLANSFFGRTIAKIKHALSTKKNHRDQKTSSYKTTLTQEQKISAATALLRSIGLTNGFAKFVVVCGHRSESANNIFHNALNCGACQGENGLFNSKIICDILNDATVRRALLSHQVSIPTSTVFIPAEHNTTTDKIKLYQDPTINNDHTNTLIKIIADLDAAQEINNQTRLKQLTHKTIKSNATAIAEQLSNDWSSIRPEWGLVRNAAFIVAPRDITSSLDLESRVFLHSYDYTIDNNYELLNSILSGPVVVGYWINTQYLFASLDNANFGSGSKVTQNLYSNIGVMQGNSSDLLYGLPIQSLYQDYQTPYHEPIRLNVFVHTTKEAIEHILANNNKIHTLVKNEWIKLFIINPIDNNIYQISHLIKWSKI